MSPFIACAIDRFDSRGRTPPTHHDEATMDGQVEWPLGVDAGEHFVEDGVVDFAAEAGFGG